MSLKHRKHKKDESEIDITPMLDVVFIMLIFFIVTTSFVKEKGIEVASPSSNAAVKSDKGNIVIELDSSGTILVNKKAVSLEAVRPNVERLLAELPEASVILAAQKGSQVNDLVVIVDQARQAGARQVSLASTE
ncbi:transport energizing protein, ExbD/TolR family [Verrucomicrobiia bacterium DG1235]|nr:transport energizing protein, ExbD/TolR family [Verrucomicrobiae bacterium DG1235]